MKLKYRIIIQFTCLISFILIIFSLVIYYSSKTEKQKNFLLRIEKRSATAVHLFINYKSSSAISLLNTTYRSSLSRLPGEDIAIYDDTGKLIYTDSWIFASKIKSSFLVSVKKEGKIHFYKNYYATSGYIFKDNNHKFIIVTSALDTVSKGDNNNLAKTLIYGNCMGILLTIVAGYFFASQMLYPIKNINNKIKKITAYNQHKRLPVSGKNDEINELAVNFNLMLERLEYSFYQQRDFISHASHELRTPLSSMKTEIQIGLWENHTNEEYKKILENLLIDTERLIDLSSAILKLSKPYDSIYLMNSGEIIIEDLITEIQEEHKLPDDRLKIKIEKLSYHKIKGNKVLLKNLMFNLLDNALKYSTGLVNVDIYYTKKQCIIEIHDEGVGIPKDDISRIFNAFYRANNVYNYKGFGIGLSLCKNIVDFHHGEIYAESIEGVKTSFIITLPN